MIRAIGNNYNINFQSLKIEVAPEYRVSPITQSLIDKASETLPVKEHIEALKWHGLNIIPSNPDKTTDKIYLLHNIEKIKRGRKKQELMQAASGPLNTLEDAQGLMGDAIIQSWKFLLNYLAERGYKLH